MTEQTASLVDYDSAIHAAALERRLHRQLIGSRQARQCLIQEWQRGIRRGFVMTGSPDAFLFYRSFGDKLRIDNILAGPGRLEELLGCALPRLQARYRTIVSQSEAWSRVFGESRAVQDSVWARHRFGDLRVEVLEALLPAHLSSTVPSGYRISGWRPEYLPLAAEVMEGAPDPLQARVPTHGAECMEIIQQGCDCALGGLAWRADRLVGFVTVRARAGIGQLFVSPSDQGRGLGGALLDRALRQLYDLSIARARLTMVEANHAAWHLYRARGFRRCGAYPFRYWLAANDR